MPTLVGLTVLDDPERWRDLGFTVDADGACRVGALRIELVAPGADDRPEVVGWAFDRLDGDPMGIDGIPTTSAPPLPAEPVAHPNGVTSLDHVVVTTPDVDRTIAGLEAAGLRALRERRTEAGGRPMRQVFLRPGEAVIEVVGPPEPRGGRARFFGLAFTVADLDAAAARLGDALGAPKEAVQPGRRIATVRAGDGPGVPIAFMTPEPGR